ncbi:ABC transporter substrate-binding protein, partial [Candidatus Geothermarchaeota archaeon ex4572_27]
MRVFSEVLGEFVEVPEGRIRVVSLAPSVTETLFYIGAGDMLAGVSSFCRKPPEAAKLPRVGGYLGVNYRLLHELAPD